MNKKLIAVALAGAFVLPMAAQAKESNVTLSGYLNLSLDYLSGSPTGKNEVYLYGDGNTGQWNVSSNSSNIVLKGDEDLGNGLSAVWQVQNYISFGGTGNSDGTRADGWSNGNSYVGLSGKSFGTVLLGKHDTPFKLLGRAVDLFNNQIGDSRNLISNGAGTKIGSVALSGNDIWYYGGNSWDLRPNNVIAWLTPDWSGFSGAIAYTTNAYDPSIAVATYSGITAATVTLNAATGATTPTSVAALSMLAKYANGPLLVGLGYENHQVRGLSGTTNPNAWRLAGSYTFGEASKVTALWQRTMDNLVFSGYNDDQTTWGLGFSQGFGNNTVKVQYYKTNNMGNFTNTGANMWALGLDHNLSKRTQLYAAYSRTNNDDYAAFTPFGGGHGDNPGTVMGRNPWALSFGVVHKF